MSKPITTHQNKYKSTIRRVNKQVRLKYFEIQIIQTRLKECSNCGSNCIV